MSGAGSPSCRPGSVRTIKLVEKFAQLICFNIYIFVLFFCSLLDRLAVRISLPFHIILHNQLEHTVFGRCLGNVPSIRWN